MARFKYITNKMKEDPKNYSQQKYLLEIAHQIKRVADALEVKEEASKDKRVTAYIEKNKEFIKRLADK